MDTECRSVSPTPRTVPIERRGYDTCRIDASGHTAIIRVQVPDSRCAIFMSALRLYSVIDGDGDMLCSEI